MKPKMPWLKHRLKEIGRTPTALAKALGIAPPRVYEMIGGRRGIQPDEIVPTASFLGWSTEELLHWLPADQRVLPTTTDIYEHPRPGKPGAIIEMKPAIPVLGTSPVLTMTAYDSVLTGQTMRYAHQLPAFEGRSDIACLYHHGSKMLPWRDQGDLVMFEKSRPPKIGDYVVVYLIDGDERRPVMVRQMVESKKAGKYCLRQCNPKRDTEIDAKSVAHIFRVLTWDEVLK